MLAGRGALHRRLPQQGRRGRRSPTARPRRSRAAHQEQVPGRRHPVHPGLRAEGARGALRCIRIRRTSEAGADGRGRLRTSRPPSGRSTSHFLMPVEDVFAVKGRYTSPPSFRMKDRSRSATRSSSSGSRRPARSSSPASRCSRSCSTRAAPATTSAASSGVSSAEEVEPRQLLASRAHRPHERQVHVLTKDEGGRHTRSTTATGPSYSAHHRRDRLESTATEAVIMPATTSR